MSIVRAHRDHRGIAAATRGAFTLIELVAVVVILAVVAGVIVPRVLKAGSRRAEQAVGQLAELLSMAGVRDRFSSQRVAVEFDEDSRRARLAVLRSRDPARFDAGEEWFIDTLAPIVEMELIEVKAATVDGSPVPVRSLRLDFPKGGVRTDIALHVVERTGPGAWIVRLPAWTDRASVEDGAGSPDLRSLAAGAIDLDAAGMREDPW